MSRRFVACASPSNIMHRACRVERDERWRFVTWFKGNRPFASVARRFQGIDLFAAGWSIGSR